MVFINTVNVSRRKTTHINGLKSVFISTLTYLNK